MQFFTSLYQHVHGLLGVGVCTALNVEHVRQHWKSVPIVFELTEINISVSEQHGLKVVSNFRGLCEEPIVESETTTATNSSITAAIAKMPVLVKPRSLSGAPLLTFKGLLKKTAS